MSDSANACPMCGGSLPKMPPSQRRTYCSRACMGAARRASLAPRPCLVCGRDWTPINATQAARNKTCSPACNGERISRQKIGKPQPSRRRRVTVACKTCGATFEKHPSRIGRTVDHFCSRTCAGKERAKTLVLHSGNGKGKRRPPRYGPENPAWRGGVTYFRKKGNYKPIKYVRCPPEYLVMARADGYVMEHRLIVARMAGYCLTRTEVVHHIDHDPQRNADENLELWPTNSSHKAAEHGRIVPGAACRWYPPGSAPR